MKPRILVVEDEEKLRRVMALHLEDAGYEVETAGDVMTALRLADRANLVVTDIRLPAASGAALADGLDLLAALQRQNARLPVIVMTAYGSVEIAVEAMKRGAADFLTKPFTLEHLVTVVRKALEVQDLREENVRLREELGHRYKFDSIVGNSPAMQEILAGGARGAHAGHGAAGGRERGGQRSGGACHPLPFAAARQAAGEDQLHRHPRKPDGERTVRLRERRLHWGEYHQAG